MRKERRPDPPPEASRSSEAAAAESSSQPHSRVNKALRKFTKTVTKKIPKPFKRSRGRVLVTQNVDHEGASSDQNIDPSHLHPADNKHPTTSENPSGCADQGPSGEPASKVKATPSGVEETSGPQSADADIRDAREAVELRDAHEAAEIRDAHEAAERMRLLGGHTTSVVSAGQNAPADLTATYDFQTTYLQPLKIFDAAIEKLGNV
ncbi:uncharacterized protein EDB91DRAFT_208886 [Suillus paluster]|uniref:uncharacterized protein n=1 Tax=Suillus paluster TaxID=48578 RepID=UPI001B87C06C|nr:uncharacterized protein EDB91DRAFT_208886 [Suillus paluster]KAG1744050.1 hypothetical protein EDB91DRAFT_208886 [Suillus paluster]